MKRTHSGCHLLGMWMCDRWLGDSEEMAHSVEGRTPFLDHHLVDYVNYLPLDLKIRLTSSPHHPLQLSEKHLLKRAAAPYLPDAIVRKEKHPFLAPPTLLAPHSLMYHKIRDTVRGREMEELRGLVDVDRARHALDAIDREVAEGRKATLDLQELLRLEQWLLMICSLNASAWGTNHGDGAGDDELELTHPCLCLRMCVTVCQAEEDVFGEERVSMGEPMGDVGSCSSSTAVGTSCTHCRVG